VIEEMQKKFGKRLRVFRLPENRGLGLALRFGVEKCKNELIARMDSDDISVKNRIEKQLEVFEKIDVDVVGTSIIEYDKDLKTPFGIRSVPEKNEDIIKFAKTRNPMNHVTVCFRKDRVLEAGNYENMLGFEDYYLWVRMIKSDCKFYNVQKNLLKVRSGMEMIKRRGGVRYLSRMIVFEKKIKEIGFLSFWEYSKNVFSRGSFALVPNTVRKIMYGSVLRNAK